MKGVGSKGISAHFKNSLSLIETFSLYLSTASVISTSTAKSSPSLPIF
jgi:hypothetical protein